MSLIILFQGKCGQEEPENQKSDDQDCSGTAVDRLRCWYQRKSCDKSGIQCIGQKNLDSQSVAEAGQVQVWRPLALSSSSSGRTTALSGWRDPLCQGRKRGLGGEDNRLKSSLQHNCFAHVYEAGLLGEKSHFGKLDPPSHPVTQMHTDCQCFHSCPFVLFGMKSFRSSGLFSDLKHTCTYVYT